MSVMESLDRRSAFSFAMFHPKTGVSVERFFGKAVGVTHFTCIGSTKEGIKEQLQNYRDHGIHLYARNEYDDVACVAKEAGLLDLV